MGPRPFGRGDYIWAALLEWDFRLQWGHAHSGVETEPTASAMLTTLPLQWGHAHSGVETGSPAATSP